MTIDPEPPAKDDLFIRASRPEDADELTAMSNLPGFRYGTLRLPFAKAAKTLGWLEGQGDDALHLVAVRGGALVGSAGIDIGVGRRRHVGSLGIGVHDDHVGTGVGSALVSALLDTVENWLGLTRIELTVNADNARAIALYEKFGFEREGLFRRYALRDGVYIDALAMARLR